VFHTDVCVPWLYESQTVKLLVITCQVNRQEDNTLAAVQQLVNLRSEVTSLQMLREYKIII
jgi:hypothetical protein